MTDFNFVPGAKAFNSTNASAMGHAARLAYQDEQTVKATVEGWGFEVFHFFDESDSEAFVAANTKMVLLSFRGTESPQDFVTDIKVRMEAGPGGQVHRGFKDGLEEIWVQVRAKVAELQTQYADAPLWITGHSLGAALATLAAAKFTLEEQIAIQGIYTFGSPRVGDTTFAEAYDAKLKDITFRFRNNNDVVTRVPVPLRMFPYQHVGTMRYFDVDGRLVESLSWWRALLDRLRGRIRDLGNPGTDGMKDHAMNRYVELLDKNLKA